MGCVGTKRAKVPPPPGAAAAMGEYTSIAAGGVRGDYIPRWSACGEFFYYFMYSLYENGIDLDIYIVVLIRT